MNILGIIPARFASSRFPGKPLADINGKSMIRRVYEQASQALPNVAVATDDHRIINEVESFGANAIMTSNQHKSGTDRCYEAAKKWHLQTGINIDVIVNIQGDEPFIHPTQLSQVVSCFDKKDCQIATLVKPITKISDLFNVNKAKVVLNTNNEALFFSRSPIPYIVGTPQDDWLKQHQFYKHIGVYAYQFAILKAITHLTQTPLEIAESLEQLRWLEHGYKIKVAQTEFESLAIDTKDDLAQAVKQ